VLGTIANGGEAPRPFTADEVKQARADGAGVDPSDLAAARSRLPVK